VAAARARTGEVFVRALLGLFLGVLFTSKVLNEQYFVIPVVLYALAALGSAAPHRALTAHRAFTAGALAAALLLGWHVFTFWPPDVAAALPSFESTRHPLIDLGKVRNRDPLHRRSYIDFKLRLADHLLADHGDRVAYASSIEARYPFLDRGVIDLARQIPPSLLIRNDTEKYLLREAARRHLPPEILAREKFAFVAPGSSYLLSRNVEWIDDLLSPATIRRQGWFNPATVEHLKSRAASAQINTTFETDLLMIVLTFGIFYETFIENARHGPTSIGIAATTAPA